MNLYRLDYVNPDGTHEGVTLAGVQALGRRLDVSRRLALDLACTSPQTRGNRRPVLVSKIDGRTLRVSPLIVASPDGKVSRV